jgi:hypothetical protein
MSGCDVPEAPALVDVNLAKEATVKGMSSGILRGWGRFCVAALLLLALAQAQAQNVVDHLSVPGPLVFAGDSYGLVWSSHPSPQLYKQEYLPAGQTLERYSSMLMVDVWLDGLTAAQKATAMVESLAERKKTDPLVNYDLLFNEAGTELLLDFVLSAPGADGNIIVEWNAYRYRPLPSGVLLTAISRRAYGEEAALAFLRTELKQLRERDIGLLTKLEVPVVVPAADTAASR